MKKTKKWLSMLLAVVMALSLMPISSFADGEDSGNEKTKIQVAGVPITETGEVTGAGITGTVSYDSEKNILTLDGATITAEEDSDGNKIAIRAEQDLKIKLIGSNTIQAEGATKENADNIGISTGNDQDGYGDLSVFAEEGASLTITAGDATQGNSVGIWAKEFTLYSGTVTANAGTAEAAENKKNIGVSVGKLTMENGTLTAKGETQAILAQDDDDLYTEKTVTVANDTTSSLAPWDGSAALFTTESEFQQIMIEPSFKLYPIWVAGTRVTENNKGDVLNDGTVVFDGTDKLTLNSATIETDQTGIYSYEEITINLTGENTIKVSASNQAKRTGILGYDYPADSYKNLTLSGDGDLTINVEDSDETDDSYGIDANDLTIDAEGTITVSVGSSKTWSKGISAYNFTQNKGKLVVKSGRSSKQSYAIQVDGDQDFVQKGEIEASAGQSDESFGVYADEGHIKLEESAKLVVSGYNKALRSAPIINVDAPSILVSESTDASSQKKVEAEAVNTLGGDGSVYKWVKIVPGSTLANNLQVSVDPTVGVTVTAKVEGKTLDNVMENDLVQLEVKITDSNKVLDKILINGNDKIVINPKEGTNSFIMPSENVSVKAVLKDKPVAPSTGGGGGGGFTSQSSVRPGESTATTNDPKKDPKNDPAPNVAPEVKEVRLTIASKSMKKGNENVVMDAAPFIREGRTMVPLRYVAEALGLKVSWDAKTKTVTLSNDKNQIVVPTNSLTMQMNGEKVQSDVPPVLQGGRIYLSISNIGKALGLEQGKEIRWDAAEKTVILSVK